MQAVADVMIVIVRWVLWAAPLGVFALVLAVCARVGLGMLGALGSYILLQCALYISVTLMLYVVARFRRQRAAAALRARDRAGAGDRREHAVVAGLVAGDGRERAHATGLSRRRNLAGAADGGVAVPHQQSGAIHQRRGVHGLDVSAST